MDVCSPALDGQMLRFSRSLNESDRRRYATFEATRLGHGGLEYISRILGRDPKTKSKGIAEIKSDDELASDQQRKKDWLQNSDSSQFDCSRTASLP
jgi:hypothetical protein